MKLETALKIAKDVAASHRRWGKQSNPPYTVFQLAEAIALLDAAGNFESDLPAQLTKVKRQLAACENREKARKDREQPPI